MVTLTTVENALKSVYLNVLSEQLNINANVFLSKIKQTSKDVFGKEIIIPIKYGGQYITLKSNLKSIYNSIEISDKAIRASASNAGAFVNLLNDEIENLIKNYSNDSLNYLFKETEKRPVEWINGICDIIGESEEIFGLKRKDYDILKPEIKISNNFKIKDILDMLDLLEEKGSCINMIVCSYKKRNKIREEFEKQGKEIEYAKTQDGYKYMVIGNEITIIALSEKYISDNKIYLLDLEQFTFNQLCDWRWLESENGRIINPKINTAIYNATLVKYANLMCKDISKQGLLKIEENKNE